MRDLQKTAPKIVWILISVLFFVTAIAATSCSTSGTNDELTIYSGRSESLVSGVIQIFEEQSGINVNVRYADSNLLAATLLEEGDSTNADVFFAQSPSALLAVSDQLTALPSELAEIVPNWAIAPDRRWVGVSARARVVVFNSDMVNQSELPNSLEGFTDPRWNQQIGWAPSNSSFQVMVANMIEIWGMERTREWLEGIVAGEPSEFPNNTSIVNAAIDGEISVGFVNHYYLPRIEAERGTATARNYYLESDGPGSTLLVSGVGILANSDRSDLAEQFVNFLLSEEAQNYFADTTYEIPVIEAVEVSANVPMLEELLDSVVDLSSLVALEETQALLREVDALP